MPIRILLFDLVVIYPIGTIHEYNYCLPLKQEMFLSHITNVYVQNASLLEIYLQEMFGFITYKVHTYHFSILKMSY